MPDVKIEVLLPVELQHFLGGLQRDSLGAGPSLATVVQTVIATFFVALPPPPHGPIGYPDDFSGFPPLQAPGHRFKITSCTFIIRSISADKTVCSGFTPSASHPRQADKSLLIGPDKSHANNSPRMILLTTRWYRVMCPWRALPRH